MRVLTSLSVCLSVCVFHGILQRLPDKLETRHAGSLSVRSGHILMGIFDF